jgi:hypothetical protein
VWTVQIVRDWVVGFNARGPDGLINGRRASPFSSRDQARWHMSNSLAVPENITILPLPPKSSELHPVKRRIDKEAGRDADSHH